MDGNGEHLTDAQQVHEGPEQGGNERGYRHEQEEMCGAKQSWRGCGHTNDAEHLEE